MKSFFYIYGSNGAASGRIAQHSSECGQCRVDSRVDEAEHRQTCYNNLNATLFVRIYYLRVQVNPSPLNPAIQVHT